MENQRGKRLRAGVFRIAGLVAITLATSWLLVWRWNHEMVRVYDLPPSPWWLPGSVLFSVLAVWVWVKRAELFR